MSSPADFRARLLRFLRTLHGWLGIFIFPWIIAIGATGFYLNHPQTINAMLSSDAYDEAAFDEWTRAAPVTREDARLIAVSVWPGEPVTGFRPVTYHDRPGFEFIKPTGSIIISRPSGHYFVKTTYTRRTFAPDGTLLHKKTYWSSLFKRFHRAGWLDRSLGTWLADLTSLAMVIFGLSGVFLWWMPRSRRIMRRLRRG